MTATLWHALLAEARADAPLRASPLHGERHWRAVAAIGLGLRGHDPAVDRRVMLAFGMLHDCRRFSEGDDHGHGPRAAAAMAGSRVLSALMDAAQVQEVLHACRVHTAARRLDAGDSASAAACLDADRFTLRRVGTEPRPAFFSLDYDAAAFRHWLAQGDTWTLEPPSWEALIASVAPDA